jgi:hypothetical protein
MTPESKHPPLSQFALAAFVGWMSVTFAGPAWAQTDKNPLPQLVSQDGRHVLLVDGAPFLILGAQCHNSSAWPAMLPNVWLTIEFLHANTVEVPIYWEQIEPQPGKFDFSLVDTLLQQAREHKLTLLFTRFLAGPAGFTPGGFLNRQGSQFKVDGKAAQVQGTRSAELALFVVYDSPICCVCDHPRHYRDQPGVDFLKIVPTVWDDTRVLDAAVGEHLATEQRTVTAADLLALHLTGSGGAVARFEPVSSATPPK